MNKISENNCKEIKRFTVIVNPCFSWVCHTHLGNYLDSLIRDKGDHLLLQVESDLLPSGVLTGKDSATISYMFG